MKSITRAIDIFLYTSLFTACCATGLCMATGRLILGSTPPVFCSLHFLVFGSTLLVYNTPRIARQPDTDNPEKGKYRPFYYIFFFIGKLLTIISLSELSLQLQLSSLGLGIFAFAYFLPVLPFKEKKRLRDFGWLKIIVLAGVWTTATSVLPMLYWHKNIADFPLEILIRLVFIFTLCVIFDIRDIRKDMSSNISTLPGRVGLRNSYLLINFTLLLFVGLSIFQYWRYPSLPRLAGALLTAVLTRVIVSYLRTKPSARAYLILADGAMIIYSLLVLLN